MGPKHIRTDSVRRTSTPNRRNLSRLLTERLRDLEEKGFIYRHYEPPIPPAVTYGLTKRLEEIGETLNKCSLVKSRRSRSPSAHLDICPY
jgi:DNA-binding HxlR family transcriptional regulator